MCTGARARTPSDMASALNQSRLIQVLEPLEQLLHVLHALSTFNKRSSNLWLTSLRTVTHAPKQNHWVEVSAPGPKELLRSLAGLRAAFRSETTQEVGASGSNSLLTSWVLSGGHISTLKDPAPVLCSLRLSHGAANKPALSRIDGRMVPSVWSLDTGAVLNPR